MRMSRMLFVGVSRIDYRLVRSDHVHLGGGQSAAAHLARLQPRAYIQRGGGFLKARERNARIQQGAQQHVAAYAGKTLQVSNSHRFVILNGRPRITLYAPRRARTSAGRIAFIDPERKPAQSRVTYWKPAFLSAAEIESSISMAKARGSSARAISTRASSP